MSKKSRTQTRKPASRPAGAPPGTRNPPPRRSRGRRPRRRYLAAGLAVAVIGLGVGLGLSLTGSSNVPVEPLSSLHAQVLAAPTGPAGPEGVPVPTASQFPSSSAAASGSPVDGIQCNTTEQTIFHIHAHLTIFVDGVARQIPAGVGVPNPSTQATPQGPFVVTGTCFYWLHTHAADGIIHIESPVHRGYTLGNFFDIWGQPLSSTQVGDAHGNVVVLYNGQVYRGNPQDVPLQAHAQIQLDVGTPLIAPVHINFPHGL